MRFNVDGMFVSQNRRERISERLKTLQELVPNGSKVDLVTMLEKAISYVKFLQLQVKVGHLTQYITFLYFILIYNFFFPEMNLYLLMV